MFELKGKYGTAKVFTDLCEESAQSQIVNMLNQKFIEGSTVRIMPDVHAGNGCTIGTTLTITDKVVPNLVGVDIGCGMEVTEIAPVENLSAEELSKLDSTIRTRIPSGCSIRGEAYDKYTEERLKELKCAEHIDIVRASQSIGTLGGGNHFIEVDQSEAINGTSGRTYLVVHSGSRHLGLEVAKYYQNRAIEYVRELKSGFEEIRTEFLKKFKKDAEKFDQFAHDIATGIPDELAYCTDFLFDDYIHDMSIVQEFAKHNRNVISEIILDKMGWVKASGFTTIHNYIDIESMILRKGAVSAKLGEKLIIPMNMRDGSLICIGKGNSDWNYSAPHGAGRLMSRSVAKDTIALDDFKETMKDVFTTSVCTGTIDESPMAYKPMESIIKNIGDTVDIVEVIKPIYNFKASN